MSAQDSFITTAVVREAMASIVREMRRSIVRSSYSSIIYEGYDFSCVLVDAAGRLVAQSGEDHPFHIIPVAWSVRGLLERGLAVDDRSVFLHNDPYTGGTHLNDVAAIWPVLEGGRPILFIVVRSHWADIGGMSPGSLSGGAREILQEGLRLNHIRIPREGSSDALRVILDNVRSAGEAASDLNAVFGICRVAEGRVRALLAKYGTAAVLEAVENMFAASERRMRKAIEALPEGSWTHRAYLDGSAATGCPIAVQARLTVASGRARVDFSGTAPQVAAPLNAGPAIGPTSVLTILKSFLDPGGIINDGTLRCFDVTVPPGTILSATPPAPCGGLNEVRFAADAAVMGALAKVVPEVLTGDVRGTSNHTYIGGRFASGGRPFIFYEYPSGGTGGSRAGDGNHAVRAFNEGENVSIQSAEVVEVIYPLRVLQNELRPDSGGAGAQRGGCGLVRRVLVETDEATLSVLSDRNLVPPGGVNGGGPGAPNRYEVIRNGESLRISDFPGKVTLFPLRRGDVVVMRSSGGGGFGDPGRRDPALLRADLDDGVVTVEGLAAYGVALGPDGAILPRGERAAPVRVARAELPALHLARISAALATECALRTGQLLELWAGTGPAMRFWVEGVVDDATRQVWLHPDAAIGDAPLAVRPLPSLVPEPQRGGRAA
ncbi:hydantoinase B/oxoprolinase family protein [Falsiroseomonas oryzae]|uniref:hydantoinase B/oxoprolinase family protein n=1 Tax=Falsiroseomonas oryzae TaxID=2766473 RepID=UPI0022EB1959|nr:hydantoinase B/oxoprolinase family protein [Roseomonas sp. MO-31]